MNMKDVNKLPAAIVPMERRFGFVSCHDCVFCAVFDERTVDAWAGKLDLFGSCIKRAPTSAYISEGNSTTYCAFPVVTYGGGCFEGKRLTEEEIMAARLADK